MGQTARSPGCARCDGPALAPAYTTNGGPVPDERRLGLSGYPGGFDLVGNWVHKQFQLDVFGEALLLLATAARRDRLDSDGWRAAEIAVDAVSSRWREPDAGIWEIDNQAWTHSRLICVAGLRAAAGARPGARADSWSQLADTILADTAARATHPSGRWQRSATDPRLDGSLLIPPVRGAVSADDPRTAQTLRAYTAELTEDGYAYRFRPDDRPLGEAEGALPVVRVPAGARPPSAGKRAAWLASPPDGTPPAHRANSSAPGAAT